MQYNQDTTPISHKREPIQVVQTFKFFGIDIPSTNWWNVCMGVNSNQVGIVNICLRIKATKVILGDGEMRMMLLNAMVVRVLIYTVELSGVPISLSAWNKIENIK